MVIQQERPTGGQGPPALQGLVHGVDMEHLGKQKKHQLSSPEQVEQQAKRRQASKMNKEKIASIGANTKRLTAIVGLLVA